MHTAAHRNLESDMSLHALHVDVCSIVISVAISIDYYSTEL